MPYSPYPSIDRLRPHPDPTDGKSPIPIPGPRPRGTNRPHSDAKVAEVRRLIETTTLTYLQIQAKTGVDASLACRWRRDRGWQRPLFAARSTDMVPRERASAHLRRRWLGYRISALAERAVRELEASANIDLDKLAEALELLKMARLAAGPRKRKVVEVAMQDVQPQKSELESGPSQEGQPQDGRLPGSLGTPQLFDAGPRDVLRALRAAGIDTMRAPEEALVDFMISRAPPPEKNLTAQQWREKWMREK